MEMSFFLMHNLLGLSALLGDDDPGSWLPLWLHHLEAVVPLSPPKGRRRVTEAHEAWPGVTRHFLSQSIGQRGRLGGLGGHTQCRLLPVFSPPQAENTVRVAGCSRSLGAGEMAVSVARLRDSVRLISSERLPAQGPLTEAGVCWAL